MRRSDKGQAGFTYAQWDSLDVSDDEAEKKVKEFNKPENSMLTNYARGLLAKPGVMGVFSKERRRYSNSASGCSLLTRPYALMIRV